jgi:sterol desaturase/sphingolipid hydroxylase (fatty acid hydroxylase superfamily)
MAVMPVNYIVLAIPVFFVLIALELAITRWLEKDYYRLSDSLNDLSCGILQQLLEVFVKTALFAGYLFLYQRYRMMDVPSASVAAWVLCFLGVDFLYYWFHRLSHEVNAFWAAHVVHHQSEDYNLAVALRQGAFQGWFSWFFYLPLALVGFPPLMFLTVSSFNTLYQFWIHTRTIGRLGPLEWVLNTPSNHRVHHGRNPRYIDRNHGGTLIVWDRLFGTYQREEEEPVYGITSPLRSWNPVWANLHYWVELWDQARQTRRFSDRLRLFVKPPGWRPDDLGGFQQAPEVEAATYRKWDTPVPRWLAAYAFVQFTVVLFAASLMLSRQGALSRGFLAAGAVFVAVSLVALGGLFERKRWAGPLEAARLLVLGGFLLAGCDDGDGASRPYGEFLLAVDRETFVLRATDAETIRLATENFRGRNSMFPIGPLQRGDGGFNPPWSWHFDPEQVRLTEAAIEVCDGRPSHVQENLSDFLGGYCPWSARVVALR